MNSWHFYGNSGYERGGRWYPEWWCICVDKQSTVYIIMNLKWTCVYVYIYSLCMNISTVYEYIHYVWIYSLYVNMTNICVHIFTMYMNTGLGGQYEAFNCRSRSTKESPITGLFYRNWPITKRQIWVWRAVLSRMTVQMCKWMVYFVHNTGHMYEYEYRGSKTHRMPGIWNDSAYV